MGELIRGVTYEKTELSIDEKYKYQDEFLKHISSSIDYCNQSHQKTDKEKLELLAFCILSAIDGESAECVGFSLIPRVECNEDKYYIPNVVNKLDIAGNLHDELFEYTRNNK